MSAAATAPARLEVLGIDTAFRRSGAGETVVLLHGGAPGACMDLNWTDGLSFLAAQGFDVIAYDQPGFGLSGMPDDHSIEFRYRHLIALLQALDVGRVNLVGNSIGGLLSVLAWHRAGSHSLAIERLVLLAPFPHFDPSAEALSRYAAHRQRLNSVEPTLDSVAALSRNTVYDLDRAPADLVPMRLSMIESPGNWASLLGRRSAGNQFVRDGVDSARIDVPSLVIWGMQDRSIPVQVGFEMIPRFAAGEFVFLHECCHWPQIEQAGTVNRLIAGFLAHGRRQSISIGN